jgi:hypothetical protein
MNTWDYSTWWGLAVLVWVLLAIPLLTRQATDQLMEKDNPLLPNQVKRTKIDKLSWIWIAGLVIILLLWKVFG